MSGLKFLIVLVILFFSFSQTNAVMIAKTAEVHLSVEDGDMRQGIIVKDVQFDGEEVDISSKNFMHQKVTKIFTVQPGQYEIAWTTEKSEKPWEEEKEIKKHQKTLVIEVTDAVVYVNIRGDTLTTY